MQVKKNSISSIQYRANRQLVQANRKASKDAVSNKELVAAASKIQVSRKDPVKPSPVPNHERIPTSPTPEEQASKVPSVCYLEQQQKAEGSNVSFLIIHRALEINFNLVSVGVLLQIHGFRKYPHSEMQYHRHPPSTPSPTPKDFHARALSPSVCRNDPFRSIYGRGAEAHPQTPGASQLRRGVRIRARRRQRSHYLRPQSLQSSPRSLQASVCQAFQVPLPPLFAAR